jgi:hypothetical protein
MPSISSSVIVGRAPNLIPNHGIRKVREQVEMHLLTEVVHCDFVLEWATKQLANDFDSLEATLEADKEYEQSYVEETSLEPMVVPEEARFLVGGRATDVPLGSLMMCLVD